MCFCFRYLRSYQLFRVSLHHVGDFVDALLRLQELHIKASEQKYQKSKEATAAFSHYS